jgi:hypothetical protein
MDFLNTFSSKLVDFFVIWAADLLFPIMTLTWFGLIVARGLVFYTVKRQNWFAVEFEKRVLNFMDSQNPKDRYSFYVVVKRMLEKTFYELFEIRGIMKRRKLDYITEPSDRLFLISHGCARMVKDTLKELRYLRREDEKPQFLEISKSVIQNNASFSKLFGFIPIGPFNDWLSLIPGLFIVGGIFGTFLGIMQALPELGNMDLTDPEGAKLIMDGFLLKVAFSMGTSVVGIVYSVSSTLFNSWINPEKVFGSVVERYDRCLYRLWNRCDTNDIPENLPTFDEHRDPIEALAELAVEKELAGHNDSEKRTVQTAPKPPATPPNPNKVA